MLTIWGPAGGWLGMCLRLLILYTPLHVKKSEDPQEWPLEERLLEQVIIQQIDRQFWEGVLPGNIQEVEEEEEATLFSWLRFT
jgi:hypothetical protein